MPFKFLKVPNATAHEGPKTTVQCHSFRLSDITWCVLKRGGLRSLEVDFALSSAEPVLMESSVCTKPSLCLSRSPGWGAWKTNGKGSGGRCHVLSCAVSCRPNGCACCRAEIMEVGGMGDRTPRKRMRPAGGQVSCTCLSLGRWAPGWSFR